MGFEPEVDVFASKQKPKKVTLRGSDGREYPFIAKGSEDLRQDDRIERQGLGSRLTLNPKP